MRCLALALACVTATAVAARDVNQNPPRRPHIVFVLADDYGFADVSYHARKYPNASNCSATPKNVIETPNLDRLAASGVKLESYYVQPVCSPTRAAILTGRYATHTGIHVPLVDSAPGVLPNEEVLLPALLKNAGYKTAMVGKWHLGFKTWSHTPTERGFDSWFGYYGGSTDYYKIESLCWAGPFTDGCFESTNDGEAVTGCDLHRHVAGGARSDVCNSTEYSTILFTQEAERVIDAHAAQHGDQPLFLYLAHQAVHVGNKPTPHHPEYWLDQAPPEYIEKYAWVQDVQRRNLSAMVTVLDESVGNVTAALKRNNMWDNTLLVFSTDNGGPVSEGASNYPLRKGKGSCFEGGVKGTGFVAGGAAALPLPAGRGGAYESEALMHVTDWLPTLCEVAGCAVNSTTGLPTGTLPLDGVSAWHAITSGSDSSGRTEILHDTEESGDSPAIRVGDWKLVGGGLYNIRDDPWEMQDLSKDPAHADKMQQLQQRIAFHEASAITPCDRLTPDPAANPKLHGNVWTPWSNDTRPGCPPPPPAPMPAGVCNPAKFLADTDLKDPTQLITSVKSDSPAACCAACYGWTGCTYFTFQESSNRCWLKNNNRGQRALEGVTSGPVGSA